MSGEGIEALLVRHYAVGGVKSVERLTGGYGSLVYLIQADSGAFILRNIDDNGMNHPENEAAAVEKVRQDGIPTPEIIQGVDGRYLIHTATIKFSSSSAAGIA
jgi:Ser/Thr protein kinase RdoA (MazF antagonist)